MRPGADRAAPAAEPWHAKGHSVADRGTNEQRRQEWNHADHQEHDRDDPGAARVVHGCGVHRCDRDADRSIAREREQRPIHAGRANCVARPPKRTDDLVTEGIGLVQRRGAPIEVIRPGDRVFFEPGEDHWHGAAPTRFMSHLSMVDVDEKGNSATWGAHVVDEEYRGAPPI